MTTKASPVIDRVKEFLSLPDNWDGYGGKATDDMAVFKALEFISYVDAHLMSDCLYWAYPYTDGGIGIEFKKGKRGLAIEITPSGLWGGYLLFKDDDAIGKPDFQSIEEDLEGTRDSILNANSYFSGMILWVQGG